MRSAKNIIKRSICILSAVATMAAGIPVYAQTSETEKEILQKKISTLTNVLSEILKAEYDECEKEALDDAYSKGYDYSLTKDSFEDKGYPYDDMEYVEILSAYMTIKNHKEEAQNEWEGISGIPFIDYETTPVTFEAPTPVKIPVYTPAETQEDDSEEGLYTIAGYDELYSEMEVPVGEETETGSGLYRITGYETVTPEKETLTYGNVEFTCIDAEGLFEYYGMDIEKYRNEYETRIKKLNEITSDEEISQTILVYTPSDVEDYNYVTEDMTPAQQTVIGIAQTLIGRVPYEWGGKASKAGYDTSWWSFGEDGKQKGLDCSGFVQWVFMTAGYDENVWSHMTSSAEILQSNFEAVLPSDIKVGDLGLLYDSPEDGVNHVGIYIGNNQWIHCSSGRGTVDVSEFNFTTFRRVLSSNDDRTIKMATAKAEGTGSENNSRYILTDDDELNTDAVNSTISSIRNTFSNSEKNSISEKNVDTGFSDVYYTIRNSLTENDVYTVAQLVSHEAQSEGMNGWIAVAEVVRNRLISDKFPDSVNEVVYQSGQFAGVSQIKSITPSDDILNVTRQVLNGSLSVLNNTDVLYYKNPLITDGISADTVKNWDSHQYYTYVGHHAFYLQ